MEKSFTFLRRAGSFGKEMTNNDYNFWGELVVPVGVSICFGVALVVWFFQELKLGKEERELSRAKAQPLPEKKGH